MTNPYSFTRNYFLTKNQFDAIKVDFELPLLNTFAYSPKVYRQFNKYEFIYIYIPQYYNVAFSSRFFPLLILGCQRNFAGYSKTCQLRQMAKQRHKNQLQELAGNEGARASGNHKLKLSQKLIMCRYFRIINF